MTRIWIMTPISMDLLRGAAGVEHTGRGSCPTGCPPGHAPRTPMGNSPWWRPRPPII